MTADNETYVKLLATLDHVLHSDEVLLAWGEPKNVLDAIWPDIAAIIATGNLLAMDHTRTPASIDVWYLLTNQESPPSDD